MAFRGTRWVDAAPQSVPESLMAFDDFAPGEAILHLGGQYHSAKPIESGERANLIVWLHGKYEVVRFAPHDEHERLTPAQRWHLYAADASESRFRQRFACALDGSCNSQQQSRGEEQEDLGHYPDL